jgi:acyl carrier protein
LLRDELLRFLADQGVELPDEGDAAPLLEMGLLDSLALFNLALWIEEHTGAPVDPTAFEVEKEWGSVRAILAFVSARTR